MAAGKRRGPGEGSIYRVAGRGWAAALPVAGAGQRRRVVRYAATHAAALRKLGELRWAATEGLPIPPERLTVRRFLTTWLHDHARGSVRPSTYRRYAGVVENVLVPELGRVRLKNLAPHHVERLMADRFRGGVSASTVNREREILRNGLNVAVKWGLLSRNVAALADPMKGQRRETDPLTVEETRTFLASVRGDRLEALYLVAAMLGMRQGEILGLRWQDVDIDPDSTGQGTGELRVRVQFQTIDGEPRLVAPKSHKSIRTLTLPSALAQALREHRQRQNIDALKAGKEWNALDLVFVSEAGTPLDGVNLTKRFQRRLASAGVHQVRFHDLRHGAAALLLAEGVPLQVVSRMLGHSGVGITADLYGHVEAALKRDAAERMAAALGRAP